jgi:transcription elongation factor SPT6
LLHSPHAYVFTPFASEDDEDLEEDDLELLEENTGASFRHRPLKRLTRGRDSASPSDSAARPRKVVIESSDDDLDLDNDLPKVQDIQRIWDSKDDEDDADMDDMDAFIDYSDEEGMEGLDEQEREEKRKERQRRDKARRKVIRGRPELAGIDAK